MFKYFFLCLAILPCLIPVATRAVTVIDVGLPIFKVAVGEELLFTLASETEYFPADSLIIWNLGDGGKGEGDQVAYKYNHPGEYLVSTFVVNEEIDLFYNMIVKVAESAQSGENTGGIENIVINEVFPDPVGRDEEGEFIELYNAGSKLVDIEGWRLEDASGRKYIFSAGQTRLSSGDYLLIPRSESKIILNNDQDEIKLYDSGGQLKDRVAYESKVPEGKTWSRLPDNNWAWTEPTPGRANAWPASTSEASQPDQIIELDADTEEVMEKLDGLMTNSAEQSYNARIILNEIFPNPIGRDEEGEFIEIKNKEDYPVALGGYILTDKQREYVLAEEVVIAAQSWLVFPYRETKISLNNSGDQIILKDPSGRIIDQTEYGSAQEDWSWSRDEADSWFWTDQVTPGQDNLSGEIFSEELRENYPGIFLTSLAEIHNLPKGELVIAQGIVTVEPGIFARQYFYMQDAWGGVQVYMYYANWPELESGDLIEVAGELSEALGEKRLKVSNPEQITVLANGQYLDLVELGPDTDLTTARLIGRLVKISGVLLDKKGDKLLVNSQQKDFTIAVKAIKDSLPSMALGDILEVVGVWRRSNDSQFIYPRYQADLFLSPTERADDLLTAVVAGQTWQLDQAASINKQSAWRFIYLVAVGVIIFLALKIYWLKKKAVA